MMKFALIAVLLFNLSLAAKPPLKCTFEKGGKVWDFSPFFNSTGDYHLQDMDGRDLPRDWWVNVCSPLVSYQEACNSEKDKSGCQEWRNPNGKSNNNKNLFSLYLRTLSNLFRCFRIF
jgi:hypothetical protein